MANEVHRHHNILRGLDLCRPDRSEQILDLRQNKEGLRVPEANQNTFTSLETLLASLAPFEINSDIHSRINQMVESNYSPQATAVPPQDKIIRTLIAYADNEDNPRRRSTNEGYRQQIDKLVEMVSKQICQIYCIRQEVAIQNAWETQDYLERSHLVLLLVDENFIRTEYCFCPRLKRAILRHASRIMHVIPIYLRPCLLENSVPFAGLPFYPSRQKPVSQYSNKDSAFRLVLEGMSQAAKDIRDRIL